MFDEEGSEIMRSAFGLYENTYQCRFKSLFGLTPEICGILYGNMRYWPRSRCPTEALVTDLIIHEGVFLGIILKNSRQRGWKEQQKAGLDLLETISDFNLYVYVEMFIFEIIYMREKRY